MNRVIPVVCTVQFVEQLILLLMLIAKNSIKIYGDGCVGETYSVGPLVLIDLFSKP